MSPWLLGLLWPDSIVALSQEDFRPGGIVRGTYTREEIRDEIVRRHRQRVEWEALAENT
jgi:hypothetical protein